ncbi:MAG: hypothetical protein KBD23_05730 [Gammaproteobacteria bacterium]|nr:hypothetical protein [Gammaproteobacteria bacterium]MBP9729614.1 hypothetical protein [Gammaproteobacteria bacterium]
MLRLIGWVIVSLLLNGCASQKVVLSPEERTTQEQKMRDFLNDSSPRNMNQQSKATPEFTTQFRLPGPRKQAPHEAPKETPKASDSDYLEPGRD